jgi:hypothetical protein
MFKFSSYQVQIQDQADCRQYALLTPALQEDMPSDWSFDWAGLYRKTDFDCQNIVKLVYEGQLCGLVRYGLYIYPYTAPDSPQFLEIEHLEASPASRTESNTRLIEPVGKWLIWYATKVALQYCSGGINDTPVLLTSLESAISYYRDIIQMQYLKQTAIAPGEDGYVFKFSRADATAFCKRQESQWGTPTPTDT